MRGRVLLSGKHHRFATRNGVRDRILRQLATYKFHKPSVRAVSHGYDLHECQHTVPGSLANLRACHVRDRDSAFSHERPYLLALPK